jgi:hypothetical protein
MAIYVAVYKAYPPKGVALTPLAASFVGAASTSAQCYDDGDDPAFFSGEQLEGPPTWGVCRTTLRAKVGVGDVVAFFARRPDASSAGILYLFKGFATVARKISHVDIWTVPAEAAFQSYLNLLIRPSKGGRNRYRWWEPAADHSDDWLWRVCGPRYGGKWKHEFGMLGSRKRFVNGFTRLSDGVRICARENYIIFSDDPSETAILPTPIEVATSPALSEVRIEEWFMDGAVRQIRDLTIGQSSQALGGRRGLKTTNPQVAHPHLPLDLVSNDTKWRSEMRRIIGI